MEVFSQYVKLTCNIDNQNDLDKKMFDIHEKYLSLIQPLLKHIEDTFFHATSNSNSTSMAPVF